MILELGQEHAGGYIIDLDDSGIHGLVAATTDQSEAATWKEAINLCSECKEGNHEDWYLPSKEEIDLFYKILSKKEIGSLATKTGDFYWSSTEDDADHAWEQTFFDGYQGISNKSSKNHVRAVRAF